MKSLKSKPKYYLEVPTDGREYHGCQEGYGWLNYGTIVAEGDSLEECLNTAAVDLQDQDGGEPRFSPVPAEQDWMHEMITEAFNKKYPRGVRLEVV